MRLLLKSLFFIALLSSGIAGAQPQKEDAATVKVTGKVVSIGSAAGNEVFARWAAQFMALHPGATIEAIGSGSGSAFPALLQGKSSIAPMSRPMTSGMIDAFTKSRGYAPLEIDIGIGGAVVFVHPSNPIVGLTRAQLDGIWSHTYYLSPSAILSWGDAGAEGDWAKRPIKLYGPREDSGVWGLMRSEAATLSGRLKPDVVQLDSIEAVLAAVAADPSAIGFAPAGLNSASVKILPIAADQGRGYVGQQSAIAASRAGSAFVVPSTANLASERYPLTRTFRLYIEQNPAKPMPKVLKEFLKYILSDAAQMELPKSGYVPLSASARSKQLEKLCERNEC